MVVVGRGLMAVQMNVSRGGGGLRVDGSAYVWESWWWWIEDAATKMNVSAVAIEYQDSACRV
jgi:hypothetical protein